jgi:hypothetical protein
VAAQALWHDSIRRWQPGHFIACQSDKPIWASGIRQYVANTADWLTGSVLIDNIVVSSGECDPEGHIVGPDVLHGDSREFTSGWSTNVTSKPAGISCGGAPRCFRCGAPKEVSSRRDRGLDRRLAHWPVVRPCLLGATHPSRRCMRRGRPSSASLLFPPARQTGRADLWHPAPPHTGPHVFEGSSVL